MTVVPIITKDGILQQQPIAEEIKLRGNLHTDTYIVTATSDLIINPGGVGSLRVSTTGDARGDYSIDLQMTRTLSTQIVGGDYSVICGGSDNTNSGAYAVLAGGLNNTNTGSYSIIGGGRDNSITTAIYCAISGGYGNILVAGAYASTISGGIDNTSTGLQSTICGGSNNTINAASINNTIVGGLDNIITGNYTTVCGGRNHEIVGDYASVCGGNTNDITGNYSTICGGLQNTITDDYSSIIGGIGNDIQNARSTICGGTQHEITGSFSIIGGGTYNNISGDYAGILSGNRAIAEHYGEQAHSAGQLTSLGDAQYMNLVARKKTTSATPAILYLNGTSERITIGTNTSWYFTVKVIARQINSDYTVNGWHFEGLATRDTGNISILNISTIHSFINDVAWACTITADITNQALQINVIGKTGETIYWVAKIELVKATG